MSDEDVIRGFKLQLDESDGFVGEAWLKSALPLEDGALLASCKTMDRGFTNEPYCGRNIITLEKVLRAHDQPATARAQVATIFVNVQTAAVTIARAIDASFPPTGETYATNQSCAAKILSDLDAASTDLRKIADDLGAINTSLVNGADVSDIHGKIDAIVRRLMTAAAA